MKPEKMKKDFLLMITIIFLFLAVCARAEVVYSNDFEDPCDTLTEWSSTITETSPDLRTFLGHFSDSEMVSLTLDSLPSHLSVTVSFDLYIINTWDGHGDEWGPDEWEVRVHGGPILLHTTFSNQDAGTKRQAYPDWYPGGDNTAQTGAAEVTQFGYDTLYTQHTPVAGAVYHLSFTFANESNSLQIDFQGFGLESNWWDYWLPWHRLKNESWGLDNVRVIAKSPSPECLISDDFESYSVGSYPSAKWSVLLSGNYAEISDEQAYSGTKSFKLVGHSGGSRADAISVSFPENFTYSFAFMIAPGSSGGSAGIAKSWGGASPANGVNFNPDDNFFTWEGPVSPYLLEECIRGKWYKVSVTIKDFSGESPTADVTIAYDGNSVTHTDIPAYTRDLADRNLLQLHTFSRGATQIYFDDICIAEIFVTTGPVAHWKFDEGMGSVAYDSAGNNDGTLVNGPMWTTGIIDGALDFDGVDDYVDILDDSQLSPSQAFTASAWIWTDPDWLPAGGYPRIVCKHNDVGGDGYTLLLTTGPCLKAFINGQGFQTQSQIPLASWSHVALTFDSSDGKAILYIDGQRDPGELSLASPLSASGCGLRIGDQSCYAGGTGTEVFHGKIDDVRIYDRALSAAEVMDLYAPIGENLLVNGDFETMEVIRGGWPSEYGDWSGDYAFILPRYGDVWPYQGSQLLQFSGTSAFGSGDEAESQVYQIVDVSLFAGSIAAGKATATAWAYFNRLAGDAETDTAFSVDIRAFAGDPCSLPGLQDMGGMHIAEANGFIYTDGDPATWEQCGAELVLPVNTDYVVVGIHAIENVYNDVSSLEFDGHSADAASLIITVEPKIPEPEHDGIYYVDGVNGSDDSNGLTPETAFATIQMGIDTAADGNSVFVYPAVYDEALLINNTAIKLQGVATSAGIPIVQKAGDYAVSYYVTEGPDSLLKNFVIRNSEFGIFIVGGAPTIRNVTIVDNMIGIAAYAAAQPDISNCIFWNNTDGHLFGDPVPIEAKYSFVAEAKGPNVPPADLVSHWKLDEGSGTTAYDSAGTNDGILYGSPNWVSGISGTALDFDGVGERDYVLIAGQTGLLGGSQFDDLTVGAWFKTSTINNTGPYAAIVADETTDGEFAIAVNEFGNAYGVIYMEGSTGAQLLYGPNATDGEWHNMCLRKDSSEVALFVDITKYDTVASTGPLKVNQQTHVTLGCKYTTYLSVQFIGIIDEVQIYDRALSDDEIGRLYQLLDGPLFADDYHLRSKRGRHWPAYDVWVLDKVTSPCVDGGDPAVEPSNEPMPNGGRINMGAYGGTAYASMSECWSKTDMNCDGIVDFKDFAIFAQDWLGGEVVP